MGEITVSAKIACPSCGRETEPKKRTDTGYSYGAPEQYFSAPDHWIRVTVGPTSGTRYPTEVCSWDCALIEASRQVEVGKEVRGDAG